MKALADPSAPKGGRIRGDESVFAVYTSFGDARRVEKAWDKLLVEAGGDAFNSFEWCEIWWRHYGRGRRLQIYALGGPDRLDAVLPLFCEELRLGPICLRVVKLVGSDHTNTTCSPLIREGFVESTVTTVLHDLERIGAWDVLYFGELPGYWARAAAFAAALQNAAPAHRVRYNRRHYPQMTASVPESYEAFLESLSRQERHNVRYVERQYGEQNGHDACPQLTPGALARGLTELIALHQGQWAMRGWLGHFGDFPGIESFHREVAEAFRRRGRVMLCEIQREGKPVAAEYLVQVGRRAHWLVGGREPSVPGRLGFCAVLRAALSRGLTEIDSLMGYYEYKRRLGAQVTYVQTVTVVSRRYGATARWLAGRAAVWLMFQAYYRIWYWRIAPALRQWFRGRTRWLNASLAPTFLRARFLAGSGRAQIALEAESS